MKTSTAVLVFATLLFALPSFGQAPDCQWTDTFTAATAGTSHANTSEGNSPCVAWRVTYDAIGMTGVSLQIEGAPYNSIGTGPGTFAAIPSGNVVQGSNPLTDPNNATLVIGGTVYYPFIRINVTTFTPTGASGSIRVRTYGYKGTSALAGATGGGGGGGPLFLYSNTVTLQQADILALNTVPFTLVPSCGGSCAISAQWLDLSYTFVTADYSPLGLNSYCPLVLGIYPGQNYVCSNYLFGYGQSGISSITGAPIPTNTAWGAPPTSQAQGGALTLTAAQSLGAGTPATASVVSGGLLYTNGDTGTISGCGDGTAAYLVTASALGVVSAVTVSGGTAYPTGGPCSTTVTTGSGDGTLTLNIDSITGVGDGTLQITTYYTKIQ